MSPEAVTQRLKLLDQLWALSVKLMQAKRPKTKQPRRPSRLLKKGKSATETLSHGEKPNRE